MRRLLSTAASAVALIAALAPGASASEQAGRPWPGGIITYYTAAARYRNAVDRAAAVWNDSGVGVRFVKTSRDRARVVLRYGGSSCEGATYAGYLGRRQQSPVRLGRGCNRSLIRLTAVHELGHVLGLGHERSRCARMNPSFDRSGTPGQCRGRPLSYWLDHPLQGDDLAGARRLYGG